MVLPGQWTCRDNETGPRVSDLCGRANGNTVFGMWLTRELTNVLACPRCKGALELREASSEVAGGSASTPGAAQATSDVASALICHACDRSYPVVHQIPDFMPDPNTTLVS